LFSFTMGWNDLLFGLTISQSINSAPVTVAISSMTTGQRTYWGAMMSGGTISSIPVVILTLALLRYYIRGLTMGALKE
jgi:multiple sugar transport system permease protein